MKFMLCRDCVYSIDTGNGYRAKCSKHRELYNQCARFCGMFRSKTIPKDDMHPWKDPESLFCDTAFLEEYINKPVARGIECKDEVINDSSNI